MSVMIMDGELVAGCICDACEAMAKAGKVNFEKTWFCEECDALHDKHVGRPPEGWKQ